MSDIKISLNEAEEIQAAIEKAEGHNGACILGKYWKERMNPKMMKLLADKEKKNIPYGFVGDGWPEKSDQTRALELDRLKLSKAYEQEDIDCRDVGDAIYQGNVLIPYMIKKWNLYRKPLVIVDIGAGYGRLAIPFLYKLLGKITYVMVDYTQIGLLTAGQFVKQMVPKAKVLRWNQDGNFANYDCVSLSAWRLGELYNYAVDLFISVHTIQEMEEDSIRFYMELVNQRVGAYFYCVNLNTPDYGHKDWELVFERGYPINRDGSFNERMWKIH